ncbi:hypothetical protein C1646_664231 [Rhizophagus diaphanus]|nr:hypothetical protein C1646_664231 [Rhizophagus diaphanus] [Rhizophagus sp. MUCL 43196]
MSKAVLAFGRGQNFIGHFGHGQTAKRLMCQHWSKMASPWMRFVLTASPLTHIVSTGRWPVLGRILCRRPGLRMRENLVTFWAFILSFSFILYIDEVPFLNLGISKANLLIGLKTHTAPLYYCLR